MNLIDFFILLIISVSVLSGWHRGFVESLLDLVRWIGSLVLSFRLYPYLSDWLSRVTNWSEYWILPVSFFVIVLLASILIQSVANLFTHRLPEDIHHSQTNKLLGTIPGFVSGLVASAILAILLLALPLPERYGEQVQNSRLVSWFGVYTYPVEAELATMFDRVAAPEPGENTGEYIELPYTVVDYTPRPDLEARMLELLNLERAKHGLQPLQPDTALTKVARRHSADMFSRGYFSHSSPEGASAADRVKKAGIPYRAIGENLAHTPTLPVAHKGLMESPGHRANILKRQFRRVGIGVLEGGNRGLMITQNFKN